MMASSVDDVSDVAKPAASDVNPETTLSSSMAPSVDGDTKVGVTSYMKEEKALRFKIMKLRLSELALRYPNHFEYCQYI